MLVRPVMKRHFCLKAKNGLIMNILPSPPVMKIYVNLSVQTRKQNSLHFTGSPREQRLRPFVASSHGSLTIRYANCNK